jgi:predicted enzyme related to lactoylglutathione lyase
MQHPLQAAGQCEPSSAAGHHAQPKGGQSSDSEPETAAAGHADLAHHATTSEQHTPAQPLAFERESAAAPGRTSGRPMPGPRRTPATENAAMSAAHPYGSSASPGSGEGANASVAAGTDPVRRQDATAAPSRDPNVARPGNLGAALGFRAGPRPAAAPRDDMTAGPRPAAAPRGDDMTAGLRRPEPRTSPSAGGPGPAGARRPAGGNATAAGPGRASAGEHTIGVAKVPSPRPLLPGLQLQPMVHVADMAEAVAFYEKLGGEINHGDRAGEWVLMQVGTAQIGLVTRPPNAARGESTVELNFTATMPLDRLEHLLREQGVTVVEVATDRDLGTQLHVETPDGMPIKIHQVEPDLMV